MSGPVGSIPIGVGTGLGSMPGTDPREAAAVVIGEAGLPHLPELPERGIGADPVGRTSALLIDIPVDHVHRNYRLTSHPTSVTRRSRDFLRWDIDALEEHWERRGLRGAVPTVKVQACGAFTFCARAELRGGHKLIRDRGAVRDVVASLTAGLVEHIAEVERRLGVTAVVQVDEPAIGAVVDGTIPPLTRLDPIAPIAVPDIAHVLETMAAEIARPVILRTGDDAHWELLRRTPSYTPVVDLTALTEREYDAVGELLDSGRTAVAAVVPDDDPGTGSGRLVDDLSEALGDVMSRLGLPLSVLDDQILVSPKRGLAGAGDWASTALSIAAALMR